MISRDFKAILKVIGHLYCNFGLDRLLAPKIRFFSILFQMESLGIQIKDLAFPIITVPSFSKSNKNWPRYVILKIFFKGFRPFSHRILAIKLAKIIFMKNPYNTC